MGPILCRLRTEDFFKQNFCFSTFYLKNAGRGGEKYSASVGRLGAGRFAIRALGLLDDGHLTDADVAAGMFLRIYGGATDAECNGQTLDDFAEDGVFSV